MTKKAALLGLMLTPTITDWWKRTYLRIQMPTPPADIALEIVWSNGESSTFTEEELREALGENDVYA